VSGIHAVRVAARIRRELKTDVDMVHAKYGEFKILVDNEIVLDAGALAFLGVLPSTRTVLETVKTKLARYHSP
jgi:hypothetical protein